MSKPFSERQVTPSRRALTGMVVTCVLALSFPAAAQSLKPETGPIPPQDAMPLYPGGVDKALDRLPAIVQDIMAQSHVPGLAVAVVHGGKTVFAKGYGDRVKDDPSRPVDEFTVFQVASVSKSISATIAAIEMTRSEASGRPLDWKDPVKTYLPTFRLGNDYVSTQATIGDFFAHRSGLPAEAGDELEDLGFKRADIIARLRKVPLAPFRISYNYANFGTTIGAEAVAAAAGEKWETLAGKLLFQPLGMTSSSYTHKDFLAQPNHAVLHALIGGEFKPIYDRNPDEQAPAGGVSSNVTDLAKWLQLLLADGKHGNDELIAPKELLPALSPQIVNAPAPSPDARSGFYGYGFNVGVNPNGRTSMGHSGAFLLGAGTAFQIVPSADVGIVVLTNGAPVGAAEAIVNRFMDIVQYGEETRDWWTQMHQLVMHLYTPVGDLAGKTPPTDPKPSRKLANYEGTYANAYFDAATVRVEGDHLALVLGPSRKVFPLDHWDGDTFALRPTGENAPEGSLSSVTFAPSSRRAKSMTINYLNGEGLGTFTR